MYESDLDFLFLTTYDKNDDRILILELDGEVERILSLKPK